MGNYKFYYWSTAHKMWMPFGPDEDKWHWRLRDAQTHARELSIETNRDILYTTSTIENGYTENVRK